MNPFDSELAARLDALRGQNLLRELCRVDSPQGPRVTVEGRPLLNFASNDYLGLADHPALKEAAARAVADFGTGSGASRLICGSLAPHHLLEEALAAFKGTEAALSFTSGFATALGVIPALMGRDDVIILDKLVHACLVDAARLSGAKLRVFAHNNPEDLERKLRWARGGQGSKFKAQSSRFAPRVLVVTESAFSMDGDTAPLREVAELKDRYGAWLMVDEAHATGLYGARGCGLAEACGVADRIEVQMGTLGKALGAAGGFIAGSRMLIDYLANRARSFIFSTAPMPAAAAAATAAVQLVQSAEGAARRRTLWERVEQCRAGVAPALSRLGSRGTTAPPHASSADPPPGWQVARPASSAIIPLRIGDEALALALAAALRERGLYAPAIRYPTVARGQARLRLTLTAAHTPEDIAQLTSALGALANAASPVAHAPAR